ncbi:MAG: hypothetical protein ACRDPE_08625 [Solirubrobacterales bacterium]
MLVLERATLGFVRNATFETAHGLAGYLSKLSGKDLVIVVSQPRHWQRPNFSYAELEELDKALASIGAPREVMSLRRGGLSVIGVPGLPAGAADANVLPDDSSDDAVMRGYLSPDQNGNFGFVPKTSRRFSLPEDPSPPCAQSSCPEKAGFRFRELGGRSGEILVDKFFPTGDPSTEERNLDGLIAALSNSLSGENVVELEARSVELTGRNSSHFQQLLPHGDHARILRIAEQVALLGGTKDGFLRVLAQGGSVPATSMPYALVGWSGAYEHDGAVEVAQDQLNPRAPLRSGGVLRPDPQSRLRPALVTSAPPRPDLADKVFAEPHDHWPLEGTPANVALSYLGSTVQQLGPDPRSEYWRQDELGPSDWRAIAKQIERRTYGEVPRDRRRDFDEDDFDEAQETLVQELEWVAVVTSYTERLANPFDKGVFSSWREAQKIGSEIAGELLVSPTDRQAVGIRYLQLASAILKVAGAASAGITASVAGVIDTGIWAFGAKPDGQSTYELVNTKAVELGVKLSEEMEGAAGTLHEIRNVIVSDPKKLAYVGAHAFCSPAAFDCPSGYSFNSQDSKRASIDVSRAMQRVAYEQLLPLKFSVLKLVNQRYDGPLRRPAAKTYICPTGYFTDENPFGAWEESQLRYATGGFLLDFTAGRPSAQDNPEEVQRSVDQVWEPYLLMANPKADNPVAPSAKILNRMFGPLPSPSESDAYNDPNSGGLGISLNTMVGAMKPLKLWMDVSSYLPFPTRCHWP